jgi:hypothetical protein
MPTPLSDWGGAAGEESKFLTRDAYFFGCS